MRGRQTQLRVEREVSQLNFNDFVSSAVFEDDDVALGNPDLRPDSTWITELSHERRLGSVGVVKLTAFHHWIEGVVDLLPLASTFEAPGNIERWPALGEDPGDDRPASLGGVEQCSGRIQSGLAGLDSRRSGDQSYSSAIWKRWVYAGCGVSRGDQVLVRGWLSAGLRVGSSVLGLGVMERSERPRFKANELDTFDALSDGFINRNHPLVGAKNQLPR